MSPTLKEINAGFQTSKTDSARISLHQLIENALSQNVSNSYIVIVLSYFLPTPVTPVLN